MLRQEFLYWVQRLCLCTMFFTSISCFIYISVAVTTATKYSDQESITESFTTGPVAVVKEIAASDAGDLPHTGVTVGAGGASTSAPPTAANGTTPASSQTPASTATPTTLCPTPPPDDPTVSRLRNLTAGEKDWRLIAAAKEGNVAELQAALTAGVAVGAADWDGFTALHWAAYNGRLQAARCLIASGASVGARNRWRQATPLEYAAYNGHAAVVRLLAASGADPNARDKHTWTPLHYAAWKGQAEAAAALLDAGADKRAKDNGWVTPLDVAKMRGYQQLIDMLK